MSEEDRVRRALQSIGNRVSAAPDAWERLSSTVGRKSRERAIDDRGGRLPAMALGLAVGLVAVLLLFVAFRASERKAARLGANPVALDSVEVAAPIVDIATSGQGVLIFHAELDTGCRGAFERLEVNNGNVNTVSFTETEGALSAGAVFDGSVWVAQSVCGGSSASQQLVRFDQSGAQGPSSTIESDGTAYSLLGVDDSIWSLWPGPSDTTSLVEVDATSGSALSEVAFPGRLVDLASEEGSLWLLDSGPGEGALLEVNPADGTVTERYDLGESPSGLVAAEDGSIWSGAGNGLTRLLDGSLGLVPLESVVGGRPIGADATGVWFLGARPTGGSVLGHWSTDLSEIDASISFGEVALDGVVNPQGRRIWVTFAATETTSTVLVVDY